MQRRGARRSAAAPLLLRFSSFFSQGHQGEVPFRALRNGAVVHYGASISGVNWAGSHAKLRRCVWHKLQVEPSRVSALFFQSISPCFMLLASSLHAQCLPVKSHPTGNQWPVMQALWLCCVQGFVPKLLLLVGLKLNHHVVGFFFALNYLNSRGGKKLEHIPLFVGDVDTI